MRALVGFLVFAAALAVLIIMTELAHALWRGLRGWWLPPSSADLRKSQRGGRS